MDPLALLLPASVVLLVVASPVVVSALVRRQVHGVIGGPESTWSGIDWPRLGGIWAGWTTFVALLGVAAVAFGMSPLVAPLTAAFAVLLRVGIGLAIMTISSRYATRVEGEGWRTGVALGGLLVGAAAMVSLLAVLVLGVVGGGVVLWTAARPERQERLGEWLADVSAGLKLRARGLSGKDLDLAGLPIRVGSVGLLETTLIEGDRERPMRNEQALALLDAE